jgi:hypothetical protein
LGSTINPEVLRRHIEQEQEVNFWGKTYRITPLLINAVLGDGKKLVGIQPLNTRPNYYVIRVDSGWDLSNLEDGELFVDHLEDVYEAIEDQFSEMEREREYLIEDGIPEERAELAYYPERLGWPVLSAGSGVGWFELNWPKNIAVSMTPANLRTLCDPLCAAETAPTGTSMTPANLRTLCDTMNPGGQSKLARLLGWHYSTLWRKLNRKSRITQSDELAIMHALAGFGATANP